MLPGLPSDTAENSLGAMSLRLATQRRAVRSRLIALIFRCCSRLPNIYEKLGRAPSRHACFLASRCEIGLKRYCCDDHVRKPTHISRF